MRPQAAVRIALVALLLTSSASAQTLSFGEPFPLTNTRYGVESSSPLLVSNGTDVFAFWSTTTNVRMTRLVEGERRGGRNVFAFPGFPRAWSVTWTGKHFLLAVAHANLITGQLITAGGEPVAEPFDIARPLAQAHPRLASNGATVLLIYDDSRALHRVTMTPTGEVTGRSLVFDKSSNASDAHAIASNGRGYAAIVRTGNDISALTFDAQGEEISRRIVHVNASPYSLTSLTIATDGQRYLLGWQAAGSGTYVAALTPQGSLAATLHLDPLDTTAVSSVWTGSEWAVAYAPNEGQNARITIAYVDAAFRSVLRRETVAGAADPLLQAANGRAIAVWRTHRNGPPVASTLPLGSTVPWFATYAATTQVVLTAASSTTATLVVWRESLDGEVETRVGVRHQDGRWFERSLGPHGTSLRDAFAASDGRDFAVVFSRYGGEPSSSVILIDDRARVAAPAAELPIDARAITWNGSSYLVAGDASGGAHVVRVTRTGASAPVLIAPETEAMAIAASGDRALVTLLEPLPCHITCPGTYGQVMYVRLNANLTPAEAPRRISRPDVLIDHAAATWDGANFVVAWVDEQRIFVELVPAVGASKMTSSFPAGPAEDLQLLRAESGSIVSWREQTTTGRYKDRIARLSGSSSPSLQTLDTPRGPRRAVLVPLPGGRLGHVAATANYDAPHHGSTRVFMQIGSHVSPELPAAPVISALHARGRIRLTWTPPAEPVNGYRVEYRIGDGSWHELDEWFNEDELAMTLTWTVRPGVAYSFRVRAFSDAGATEYSLPATVNVSKRRSVR